MNTELRRLGNDTAQKETLKYFQLLLEENVKELRDAKESLKTAYDELKVILKR